MFNPHPSLQSVLIAPGHHVWVIDDALREPDRWVERAQQFRGQFVQEAHNAYPGPELRLPDEISAALEAYFNQHVRDRLGGRRTLRCYSRLSIVTRAPEQLEPRQWICHRDRMQVPPDQCVAASVLYLFRDPRLGGTAFYAPRRPNHEIDRLVHESGILSAADFAAKYAIAAGYLTASNAWFEKLGAIEPRYNRLIFYDGALFHSSDMTAPELLSPDPAQGRLTLNGFFTCRRRLQSA